MDATIERGWEMKEVEVSVSEVLERVQSNLEAHVKAYKEALEGYVENCRIELRDALRKFNKYTVKDVQTLYVTLPLPTSHENDYKQVIEMLKFEKRPTIKLTSDEFACYIMDKWNWKGSFEAVSTRYSNFSKK